MPRHKQVTRCLRVGPVSKFCSCEHCTLAVCVECGSYEGSLTTDCPGSAVTFDRQKEVYETNLDYTDARGWHQGTPSKHRSPRFEREEPPQVPPTTSSADLKDELAKKAIAWVHADRTCEDHSATLTRVEDEVDAHMIGKAAPDDRGCELLAKLEREKIDFHIADQRAQRCDDEFRQVARRLVDEDRSKTDR